MEYAYRQQADYDLVWWVRGEQPANLLADYAALALQPPLAADLALGKDVPQETVLPAVWDWLEHHQRWLLVLDNVEDPELVADLLPRARTGHVVVTSRTGVGWEQLATPLTVEVLTSVAAAGFLMARTGETGAEAEAAATALADLLGGLPLALEQAGAYVATTGTVTMTDYAKLFTTRASELLKRGQPLGYQRTVATTWSLTLQTLEQAEPVAIELLTLASFLAPDDLPLPLLTAHSEQLPEPLATTAADPLALADTVAALRRYSLMQVIGDGLFVHRLLQTVVRAALGTNLERFWTAAALQLVVASFPYESAEVVNWPDSERLLPHVLAVADHGQRLEVEPEAWLLLLGLAAQYLWSRGQYRQALTQLEQALAASRRLLSDGHLTTLTLMNNLAETRRTLGDLEGARDLLEQTLAASRRLLGDDHPDTLISKNHLAAVRRKLKL